MKNFPDHDPFDALEKRLQAYEEQPDDLVWQNIDASLRPRRPLAWLPWLDHFTSALSVLLFTGVIAMNEPRDIITYVGIGEQDKLTAPYRKEGDLSVDNDQPNDPNLLRVENNKKSSITLRYGRDILTQNTNTRNAQHGTPVGKEGTISDTTISISVHSDNIENEFTGESIGDSLLLSPIKTQRDSLLKGQDEIQKTAHQRKKRLAFYAAFTPGLSFQRAIPLQHDGVVVNDFLNPPILSAERFGFSVEAGMQGFITKRLEYYGGLSLYQQNQTLRYRYQAGNTVDIESAEDKNYTVTPKSSIGTVRYSMVNVGLQVGMLYHLYGKNLAHKVGAGLSYQQGMKEGKAEVYNNSGSSYFSYQLFYRNELRVNNRLRVFVQPTFTQSIRVREKLKAPFQLKPYRAGIGLGILYNF
jgi:hypothetical protein